MPKRPPSSRAPSTSKSAADGAGAGSGAVVRALVVVLNVYRSLVSPLLPGACRFAPSCSAFAVEALARHGAVRGLGLSLARLARCHPWHGGGYDPVPARRC